MYAIEKGRRIDQTTNGIQAVTLAATATSVTVKPGKTFYVYNTGNAVMYVGPTASLCDTPGLPIYPSATTAIHKDGPFVSISDTFYMRGAAGQTATIVYLEDLG